MNCVTSLCVLLLFSISCSADPLYDIELTVAREGFDGKLCWVHARAGAIPSENGEIHYLKHGSELTVPVKRGLYEPSIARFGDRFYLTMRNDDHGYISISDDGLEYSEPRKWTFDNGSDLGN